MSAAPRFFISSNKSRSSTPAAARPVASGSGSNTGGGGGAKAPPPAPAVEAEDRRIGEYSSTDDVCPVCKSDRYLNPKLRLMVSFCYHKMCESCMDRIFSLGPEPCPICRVTIRKNGFKPQVFENLGVQKEVAIRKRTAKIFNKRQEDFVDLKSYNDYLEKFEIITFNLINDQDIEATEAAIRSYEQENRAQIEANLSKTDREAEQLRLREEEERRRKELIKEEYERQDEEDRLAREEEKRRVIASLEGSSASTQAVMNAARKSALLRSTARSNAADPSSLPSIFNLPQVTGLKSEEVQEVEEEDILADLGLYDAYESLYDVRSKKEGYAIGGEASEIDDTGGFVVEEVWEKEIRSALAGLWTVPLGWGQGASEEQEKMNVKLEGDVKMEVA